MKSPFPGMDPYLEQHWRDVHHSLCTYARDAIQAQVRPALLARVEERLVVESTVADDRSIYPDVKIIERQPWEDRKGGGGTAVAEPLVLLVETETATEGFIQIIDPANGGKLVTVIEFMSLSNKTHGTNLKQYRQKQQELTEAGVSLVEIDLLRDGEWAVQVEIGRVPRTHRSPYRVCVRRGWKHNEYLFYHLPIERQLPAIRIPLRKQDPAAILDLQALIDLAYQNGAYDEIDYRKPPVPALEASTQAWAAELIARRTERPAT